MSFCHIYSINLLFSLTFELFHLQLLFFFQGGHILYTSVVYAQNTQPTFNLSLIMYLSLMYVTDKKKPYFVFQWVTLYLWLVIINTLLMYNQLTKICNSFLFVFLQKNIHLKHCLQSTEYMSSCGQNNSHDKRVHIDG